MVGVDGMGLTISVIVFDVTGEPETQDWLVDKIQVTRSPLPGAYVYVVLLDPTFDPFTCHW
jgi:hypothetical protein